MNKLCEKCTSAHIPSKICLIDDNPMKPLQEFSSCLNFSEKKDFDLEPALQEFLEKTL